LVFRELAGIAIAIATADLFVGTIQGLIEPLVGDDARPCGAGAGEDGGVAGTSLGRACTPSGISDVGGEPGTAVF
jgi:hypothetical protein